VPGLAGKAAAWSALSEHGVDTIVVEGGGYHFAKEFTQREEDTYPML
jgi:hypothetical protein